MSHGTGTSVLFQVPINNMEAASSNSNHLLDSLNRLLPAVVPVLLISVGYVDPGKWAATVEGGARFGFDLLPLMLVFNFAAILCQYLSARIGLVTGRDLAQVLFLPLQGFGHGKQLLLYFTLSCGTVISYLSLSHSSCQCSPLEKFQEIGMRN